MGFGQGTKNHAKILSLKLLLLFSTEKRLNEIQVMGDSMVTINWENKSQHCLNLQIISILDEVHELMTSFELISI
jgi:hypothetical protein